MIIYQGFIGNSKKNSYYRLLLKNLELKIICTILLNLLKYCVKGCMHLCLPTYKDQVEEAATTAARWLADPLADETIETPPPPPPS
jgi:hypothetical protein